MNTGKIIDAKVHDRASALLFAVKAGLLRLRRGVQDAVSPVRVLQSVDLSGYPFLLAESRTALWTETAFSERGLQLGKAHNLRIALRSLHNIELPGGATFSFWRQIGRATRRRGYAEGRQISEGCLIPAVGGGLCQLSNALYDVALKAGFQIVERHPHTQVVPGSAAEEGRDATVFWNYIDLRFMANQPVMMDAHLTADELIVRVYGKTAPGQNPESEPARPFEQGAVIPLSVLSRSTVAQKERRLPARPVISVLEHSCGSCGANCFRRRDIPTRPLAETDEATAVLVDRVIPEFVTYLERTRHPQDVLGIPLDGKRYRVVNYAWPTAGYAKIETASVQTLVRSERSRRLATQGAARQTVLFQASEALAQSYARLLTWDVTRLRVDQTLLPFLWREGHLGGREFEVLMRRPPISVLEATLDVAFERRPESQTLHDFRAPDWIREAETRALAAATRIVTPHPAVAALYPGRNHLLDWEMPPARPWEPGSALLFPYATLARKGAHAVRDAARELGMEVVLKGGDFESNGFWDGVRTRRYVAGENPFIGIAAVVAPAWIEESPRFLLAAIASGVPVLASSACGLSGLPGVTTIAPDCHVSLIEAIGKLPSVQIAAAAKV